MYLYLCVLHLSVGQCCRAWFGVWSVDIAFGRNMVCNYSLRCLVMVLALPASPIAGQQADSLSQEQLKPLTEYRQQHRRWCEQPLPHHADAAAGLFLFFFLVRSRWTGGCVQLPLCRFKI